MAARSRHRRFGSRRIHIQVGFIAGLFKQRFVEFGIAAGIAVDGHESERTQQHENVWIKRGQEPFFTSDPFPGPTFWFLTPFRISIPRRSEERLMIIGAEGYQFSHGLTQTVNARK